MNSLTIYLRLQDKYLSLFKFKLNNSGLYLIDQSRHGNHISYHSDGITFYHNYGKRYMKKIRKPLQDFSGIESLKTIR